MVRNDFNGRQAIFLAAVCGQTYDQFANRDGDFVVPQGYEVAATFTGASFNKTVERFGFILESDDSIVIAFRGTGSAVDWISDIIARQSKYPYVRDAGWTHSGITAIYRSTREQIMSALKRCSSGKPLYVTGHSLGGALAVLCALDVAANSSSPPPFVYTYGAPRVGDPTFAGAFNREVSASHRIYNEFDVVPHLPPLFYKSPTTNAVYRYMHVKGGYPLRFRNGSVPANHVIGSYYAELKKLDPAYARGLSAYNPGFCPE